MYIYIRELSIFYERYTYNMCICIAIQQHIITTYDYNTNMIAYSCTLITIIITIILV